MSLEKPEALTEDEQGKTEQRILSDAELIKTGAKIKKDGRLEVTEDQINKIKEDPESRFYKKGEVLINKGKGKISFSIGWDKSAGVYTIYFPEVNDPLEQVVSLGEDRELAEKIYNFVSGIDPRQFSSPEIMRDQVIRMIDYYEEKS